MDYQQYRKMRRLAHICCNYDDGFCIALDDGEKCVCAQSISYSLIRKWFRAANGQGAGSRPTSPPHRQAVCRMRETVSSRF